MEELFGHKSIVWTVCPCSKENIKVKQANKGIKCNTYIYSSVEGNNGYYPTSEHPPYTLLGENSLYAP